MAINKNVGPRIRSARKQLGLTQEELGERIGIGKSSISEWESGKRVPDFEFLDALADALNVKLGYLIGSTDDSTPSKPVENKDDDARAWLEAEGDMLEAESPGDMIERLMAGESPLAISIMKAFAELPAEEWIRLRDLIDQVKEKGLPE